MVEDPEGSGGERRGCKPMRLTKPISNGSRDDHSSLRGRADAWEPGRAWRGVAALGNACKKRVNGVRRYIVKPSMGMRMHQNIDASSKP